MLENFLRPRLEKFDSEGFWFQQDGATADIARRLLGFLEKCSQVDSSPYEAISGGPHAPPI